MDVSDYIGLEVLFMSLSSHLGDKNSPVRRFLEDRFPILEQSKVGSLYAEPIGKILGIPDLPRKAIVVSPASSGSAGLIGTAIDYRLRYYFDAFDCRATVAYGGSRRMRSGTLADILEEKTRRQKLPRAADLADEFFESHQSLVERLRPVGRRLAQSDEDELARACIIMAYFEQIFRAGLEACANSPLMLLEKKASLKDLYAIAKVECIQDVRNLSWTFYDNQNKLIGLPATLNPKFAGSFDIGGADADLLFGPTLVEVKTVAKPDPGKMREAILQLLGYVMLDYNDEHEIRLISIIWTRQNYMWKRPLWFFTFPPALVAKMVVERDEPSEADFVRVIGEQRSDFRVILSA
jgi:hypothetical protein